MKDAKILKKMKKHEKMTSGTPAKDLFAILIFITILPNVLITLICQ